jgi:hypothetical protein
LIAWSLVILEYFPIKAIDGLLAIAAVSRFVGKFSRNRCLCVISRSESLGWMV